MAVAACVQFMLGLLGIPGLLIRFIGPLTVVPVISLIGLTIFQPIVTSCQHQWTISLL